ncbi:MAG TPA: hypothetical protein VKA94_13965 [Hyphomicrobiales bacterium]|nr:hypothetical protein [Hyphomicrobiales bacterium]
MLNQVSSIERSHDREEIEQVRNLLFGDIQQENERRIAALEAQLKELRQSIERQMRAMAEENSASQAKLIRAMGDAIAGLGNQISALAGEMPANDSDHE